MHIMLLCYADSLPLALLCPKILPIMLSLKIDTNSHHHTAVKKYCSVWCHGMWYSTECNNVDFNKQIEKAE